MVEDAVRQAIDAVGDRCPGGLDDILLLELLLLDADENVLRAMGSRARMLLRETTAVRERTEPDDLGRTPLPLAEDIIHFAANEAMELGGYGAPVGSIHILLALFAFQGSRSEAVLQQCGLDWRPLRSITRRLGLGWY